MRFLPSSSPRSRSRSGTPRGCSCSTGRPARSSTGSSPTSPTFSARATCWSRTASRVFPARLLGRRAGGGAAEVLLVRRREASRLGRTRPPRPAAAAGRRDRHRARLPRRGRGSRRRRRCAASASSSTARTPTPPSSATATCPFLPTSTGPTGPPTTTATRRSSRGRQARSPPPPRACTSPRSSSTASASAGSSAPSSSCTWAPGRSGRWRSRTCASTASTPSRSPSRQTPPTAFDRARAEGRRVVAVGTTATRALESAVGPDGRLRARRGRDRPRDRARLPLPRRGRPGHQLPPAALVAPPARERLRRPRPRRSPPTPRRCGSATASTPTATRCSWSDRPLQFGRRYRRRAGIARYRRRWP